MINQRARVAAIALLLCASNSVIAQDFPPGASTPTATELKQLLGDKVFSVKVADGSTWRLEYKASGYMYVDTSGGFRGNGEWKVEDGRICGHIRGRNPGCNDARVLDGIIYLKRDSGEIIKYVPR